MRNIPIYFCGLLFCSFIVFSCQKMELKPSADIGDQATLSKNYARLMASGGGAGSADLIPHDEDSIERETILGYQLTNP